MYSQSIDPESSSVNIRFGLTAVDDEVISGAEAMSVSAAGECVPAEPTQGPNR